MNAKQSHIESHSPLARRGGMVAPLTVIASIAFVLFAWCVDHDSASAHTCTILHASLIEAHSVDETSRDTRKATSSDVAATHASSSIVLNDAEQPKTKYPEIDFVDPRPPEFPFRLDLGTEESPNAIELTPAPSDEAMRERLRRVLKSEIDRYPAGVLNTIVDLIILGGTVTQNGHPGGGAYLMGVIMIAVGDQDYGPWTDANIIGTFHHEVSSILLHRHWTKFDEARFREHLPAGFVYRDEQPGAIPGTPVAANEAEISFSLLNDGFLLPYAQRNLEQDFNAYAEYLMQNPEYLLEMFAEDSRVGQKARVVRDFYLAIDKRFESMLTPTEKEPAILKE